MTVRTFVFLTALSIGLAACGSSSDAPTAISPPPSLKKAAVIVTLDGQRHTCVVALSKEEQGSTVTCADIAAFIKDELRVPSGATYDLRTISEVSAPQSAAVKASLQSAGYRFVGDP